MLAPWILEHMPPHRVYVEPYGGGASVLLRKPRSYAEVYNDIDADVVNLFRVMRDPSTAGALVAQLKMTPFSREEFVAAYEPTEEPLERARRLLIRSFMGFGSNSSNPDCGMSGFRADSNKSGSTPARDWANYPPTIRDACDRLQGVVVENRPACQVMIAHDGPETLHYVDPPYLHETRGRRKRYRNEMTNKQHSEMLSVLRGLEGMVMLSGYDNEMYDRLGWKKVQRHAFADGARERTEVMWLNPACVRAQSQLEFEGMNG